MSMFEMWKQENTLKVSPFDELFDGVMMCHCRLAPFRVAPSRSWGSSQQCFSPSMFLFCLPVTVTDGAVTVTVDVVALVDFQWNVSKTQFQPSEFPDEKTSLSPLEMIKCQTETSKEFFKLLHHWTAHCWIGHFTESELFAAVLQIHHIQVLPLLNF